VERQQLGIAGGPPDVGKRALAGGKMRKAMGTDRRKRGFTLVELLVVIVIIMILAALLIVLIAGVVERARYAKTAAVVKMLDKACLDYRLDFGTFPPNDKGDSRALHYYLGRERMVSTQKVESGPELKKKMPPIIEFQLDMLQIGAGPADPNRPCPVIDAWGNLVRYKNPGFYNKRGVDLWSPGKNAADELDPMSQNFDDVTNWVKDY
jgi:prepilin-type N-terminal cleavage/methylation domain-containing protein